MLEYLTAAELGDLAPQLEVDEMAAALDAAPAAAAADVLHQLDAREAAAVLEAMDDRSQVEPLLAHEDESAGGIMVPQAPVLRGAQTADNAIDYLRTVGASAEEPYYLYVVDEAGRLEGVVGLRDLVVARPDRRMRDLMNREVLSVRADTDQEVVLQTLQHYNLRALPVVDGEGRFVGVTTADDLLGVAQQEATEDMFRMVGLGAAEEVGGPVAGSVGAPAAVAAGESADGVRGGGHGERVRGHAGAGGGAGGVPAGGGGDQRQRGRADAGAGGAGDRFGVVWAGRSGGRRCRGRR